MITLWVCLCSRMRLDWMRKKAWTEWELGYGCVIIGIVKQKRGKLGRRWVEAKSEARITQKNQTKRAPIKNQICSHKQRIEPEPEPEPERCSARSGWSIHVVYVVCAILSYWIQTVSLVSGCVCVCEPAFSLFSPLSFLTWPVSKHMLAQTNLKIFGDKTTERKYPKYVNFPLINGF